MTDVSNRLRILERLKAVVYEERVYLQQHDESATFSLRGPWLTEDVALVIEHQVQDTV